MNKLRKAITIGVMVMTVFSMLGLSASAAAPQAGDLIKMDGLSTVYFLGNDGKRYVYPHSSVFFTWHSDFSGVVTISPSELASYPLGSNIVVRAGTKLVKITTDPSVYVVTPNGVLRKIASEADAINLFGSLWSRRVIDVSDAFFTNYTIGTALASGEIPAGSLIKSATSAAVYYFDGTNYRMIASEAAFNANRFDFANLITVTYAITGGGNAITSNEFGYDAQGGSGVGPVVTGSGLTASLSSATPASMSVPQNGSRIAMAKVNLTAANDGAITVNSITVKRIGLSTYSNIDKVWAEQNGVMVASKKSMNSNDESILTFSPALMINAGQTVSLDLLASLTGSGSGNIGLSIASASAISATSASISGSFPINGNLMSPTSYNVTALSFATTTVSSNVKVGDEKVELGRFTLGFASDARDVVVSSIMVKNNGVEDLSTATMNLYLENAGNKVSTSYTVDGRYVTFYFPAGYELLKDDSSKDFYIKGDVIAKENSSASVSLALVLNKSTDLVAYEKATGFGANVSVVDGAVISNITIDSGAVTVSKKSTSPSDTTIVKGTDNTVLIANVRADEAIIADGLNLSYVYSNDNSSTTAQFENARVYLNGLLLDSFDPATSTATLAVAKAIESTLNLNKGDNEVKIVVKAKTTATASSDIKFIVGTTIFSSPTNMNPEYSVSGNAVDTTSIGGTATGGIFTVQGALLTTVRNDGYADAKSIVQGSTDVSLGKFVLKATNDEIKVTSISFGTATSTGTTTLASSIYDMKLYVDGVQVGNTVDFGTSGANFSGLNFMIAKDATKSIELKGSFDSSAANNFKTLMTVNAQDSRGTTVTADSYTAYTAQFALISAGTLRAELGGNTPAASILASKSAEQEVAQFKFTAINDDASLTELNVINTASGTLTISSTTAASTTADARIASVRLYDGATLIDSFVPVSGAGKFTITNDKVKVLANQSKTLSIKVVLNDINNDAAATNQDIHFGITKLKFKSSNGTENIQAANIDGTNGILAYNHRIRKTVPTVALLSLPTSVLTAGDQVISKFTVTADANGDVTLSKIVLTATSSANATITELTVNDSIKVNGAYKTASSTDYTSGLFTVEFLVPEVITAGTTKTFEIMAGLAVSGANTESITTKIVEDSSYATDGSFVWSDGASVLEYTYSNGYRVPGLTTATQVMSK